MVKFHFKSEQESNALTKTLATKLAGENPDCMRKIYLVDRVWNFPKMKLFVQNSNR